MSLRSALGIRYFGNAISQEKTGLSWVFSRMIGDGVHAEIHHAQVAMFLGKNPFMSNGFDQARVVLREFKKDPNRTLIVVDPRRTETADFADIHLAVQPGRDAWCMAAIIGYLVQNELLPMGWLEQHATGYESVIETFRDLPVDDFARFAGLDPELVHRTARVIGEAESFVIEEDLGIEMAPHSTLVTYLNFLTSLMTGNYGKPGTQAMFTQLAPVMAVHKAKLDENGREVNVPRLPVTGAPIVSGLYPGAFLAEEILNDHPERPRALIVESSNPVHSLPESDKLRRAIRTLDFSLAVDVAMTETTRECDYVLPASSTFEKWEATFFPRNFPENIFYLRYPLFEPTPNTLSEAEIHARLIEAMGIFEPGELDVLHAAGAQGLEAYQAAFFGEMAANPKIPSMLSYVMYRTLGPHLGEGRAATAPLWGLCQMYVMKNSAEAARAGWEGPDAGERLFNALLESETAVVIGESTYEEAFARIPFPDNKLQLLIPELLDEIGGLRKLEPLMETSDEYPFALMAGGRRAYTANTILRDPRWAKGRDAMALTMNPQDGEKFSLPEGSTVRLETETGSALVDLAYDERMHPGTIAVPNGQGMRFVSEEGEELPSGVFVNELTSTRYRDKFIGTPFHKFVPARVSLA
jgi:anaerobic selenocysteine-containing dehydrogenase